MSFRKLSMIFFILGSLLSVFSGAFEVTEGLEDIKVVTLLILGLLIGLLNISDREHVNFLVAAVAFLFSTNLLMSLAPNSLMLLDGLFLMLQNFMIFIAPAAVVISLKLVFEYASESDKEFLFEVPKSAKKRHQLEVIWDIVVFVAVAFVFVILILESFFNLTPYPGLQQLLVVLDWVVLGVFIIDLVVIFKKDKSFKKFIVHNWLDIVAVIPFGSVFRVTKVVRLARILKTFGKVEKATKMNRASKFFSGNSGFNNLLAPGKQGKKSKKKSAKKARKK
jgi:hypothetical protein